MNNWTAQQTHKANNDFARLLSDHIIETQRVCLGKAVDKFGKGVHRSGWKIAKNLLEGDFDYIPTGLIKAGIKMEKARMRNFLSLKDGCVIATARPGVYSREEWQQDKKMLLRSRKPSIGQQKAIVVLPFLCVALIFKVTNFNGIPELVAAALGTKIGSMTSSSLEKNVAKTYFYSSAPEDTLSQLGSEDIETSPEGFWNGVGEWEFTDEVTVAADRKASWRFLQLAFDPKAEVDWTVKMNTLVMETINVVSIITKLGGTEIQSCSGTIETHLTLELKRWEDVPRDVHALWYRYLMSSSVGGMAPYMEIYMGFGMNLLDCWLV